MPQVFCAVKALIQKDGNFLFIKQKVGDAFIWELPGGKVKFGESPYDTLHREVIEEIGNEIEIIKPIGMWWFIPPTNQEIQVVCNTFLCKIKNSKINLDNNPCEEDDIKEYKWLSREDFLTEKYSAEKSLKELIEKL